MARRPRDGNLASILHTGNVSRRGLHEIIKALQSEPVGEISLRALQDADLALFDSCRVEERLRLSSGSDWTWEFAEPGLLITRVLEACPCLQDVYYNAYEASGTSKWDLAIAFDEFAPGDFHRPNMGKKKL